MPLTFFRKLAKTAAIIANIIVAIAFITGCYVSVFDPVRYWFLGLFTIASFYLLIVLIGFLIFWLFVKRSLVLISLITIICCLKPIRNIIPFRFGNSDFVMRKQTNAIRVMDWNVAQFDILNYRANKTIYNEMIGLINSYQPDIACFQEMVCGDSTIDLNNKYYRKFSFYPLSRFLDTLQFPHCSYAYNTKEDYLDYQHFGIIIFSKYPIINKQTISPYPHDYNSIFQYVDIVKGNDTIRVFNLHMQSLRFSPMNLTYIDNPSIESKEDVEKSRSVIAKFKRGFLKRKIQADRVKEEIDKSPYPIIVCGDFNDMPNSYAYKTIGSNLQNAFVKKGAGIGRTFSGVSPTLRIDNIFAGEHFDFQQYIRINKKLSDHFPIITDITIDQNK